MGEPVGCMGNISLEVSNSTPTAGVVSHSACSESVGYRPQKVIVQGQPGHLLSQVVSAEGQSCVTVEGQSLVVLPCDRSKSLTCCRTLQLHSMLGKETNKRLLASRCFEPSQPQRITSGLNTNFIRSPLFIS